MAFRTDRQRYDLGINTDCFRALDKIDQSKVQRRRLGEYTTQPRSNYGRVLWDIAWLAHLEDISEIPVPDPPDPPPPVNTKRYAPRTHNLGNRDQDPRFCMKPEYGVVDHTSYFQDEMGVKYDRDGMNTDGLRDRAYMVPGLKGADSMDGMEPCDPYSANGISVPPYPGDPIKQTGSYHR